MAEAHQDETRHLTIRAVRHLSYMVSYADERLNIEILMPYSEGIITVVDVPELVEVFTERFPNDKLALFLRWVPFSTAQTLPIVLERDQ